jgi:hypothetical protein
MPVAVLSRRMRHAVTSHPRNRYGSTHDSSRDHRGSWLDPLWIHDASDWATNGRNRNGTRPNRAPGVDNGPCARKRTGLAEVLHHFGVLRTSPHVARSGRVQQSIPASEEAVRVVVEHSKDVGDGAGRINPGRKVLGVRASRRGRCSRRQRAGGLLGIALRSRHSNSAPSSCTGCGHRRRRACRHNNDRRSRRVPIRRRQVQ